MWGMVENSCSTPSMRTAVIAAPGRALSSMRRRALPSVMPKPAAQRLRDDAAERLIAFVFDVQLGSSSPL